MNLRTTSLGLAAATLLASFGLHAGAAPTETTTVSEPGDYLVQFAPNTSRLRSAFALALPAQSKVEKLSGLDGWMHIKVPQNSAKTFSVESIKQVPGVLFVQPNYKIHMLESPSLVALREKVAATIAANRSASQNALDDKDCPIPIPGLCDDKHGGGGGGGGGQPGGGGSVPKEDNPPIPAATTPGTGADPLASKQWGMIDIGAPKSWNKTKGENVIVAVIDTGIDYTHEDLVDNLWRNPGEQGTDAQGRDKSNNQVDDDGNGYVDDVIGWDFASNDNKPYDLAVDPIQLLTGGGNPGHGTHCSGNVAARGDNGKGISGVAPTAKIMGLRFITEKGEGTTDAAVKAIAYAVKNGARVMSNSWGSEGEDPQDGASNKALRDAIIAAQNAGVLFVAAAGNGHQGVGYDNDSDAKPGIPASYPYDIIVSVAAIDSSDNLGAFSNWGAKTVHIAAPGVKVFSTTVGSNYNDMVIDMAGFQASWDGTSMATPHVAGAAALYLSAHPNATWKDVKTALLSSAKPIASMSGKSVSGGKLNVERLMAQ